MRPASMFASLKTIHKKHTNTDLLRGSLGVLPLKLGIPEVSEQPKYKVATQSHNYDS